MACNAMQNESDIDVAVDFAYHVYQADEPCDFCEIGHLEQEIGLYTGDVEKIFMIECNSNMYDDKLVLI